MARKYRSDERGDVDAFVGEELAFAERVAVVAAEATTGADDTVTRNDETDGIFAHGAADGLGGHFMKTALCSDQVGDFAVGHGFAERNLAGDFKDATVEGREVELERRGEIGLAAGKIFIEPAEGFGEDRMEWNIGGATRLRANAVEKMKLKQSAVASAEGDWTERRFVDRFSEGRNGSARCVEGF